VKQRIAPFVYLNVYLKMRKTLSTDSLAFVYIDSCFPYNIYENEDGHV